MATGLWGTGVERWARLIYTGWVIVVLANGPTIGALAGIVRAPDTAWWLISALAVTLLAVVRLFMQWTGLVDIVLVDLAVVLALGSNRLMGADGAGADAGPALSFALVALVGVAVFAPTRVAAVAAPVTAVLYVVVRDAWTGPGLLLVSIDEMAVLGATGISIHILMRVLRAAAANADRLRALDLEAGRSRAREDARRHSIDEVRRVLHDDVIAALVLIDLSPTSGDDTVARDAARAAVDRFARLRTWAAPTGPAHFVAYLPVDVAFDVGEAFHLDDYPVPVQTAVAGATMESLRNVRRHAGTDRAHVAARSTDDGGLDIEISDDGDGAPAPHAHGFGIDVSIIGRMAQVGGSATITTSPGRGTTVRLRWSPPAPRSPSRVDPWSSAWSSIMAAVPDMRRGLAPIVYTYAASQAWAAVRHVDSGRSLAGGVAVAICLLWLTWCLTRRGVAGPLSARGVSVLTVALVALVALGLWNAGPGALLGFDSWVQGMTVAPLVVVALLSPARWVMVPAVMVCATVFVAAFVDPALSPAEALSPITGTVVATGPFLAAAIALRRISAQVAVAERIISSHAVEEVRITARAELLSRDLAHLEETVVPFLSTVAEGAASPAQADVRHRARVIAAQVRDDLIVPTVVDAGLRELLSAIRAAGGSVTFRVDDDPPSDPGPVRDVLATVLDAGDRWVVVTVSGSGARLAVTIRPAISDARAQAIRGALGDGLVMQSMDDRTRLDIHVPTSATGREAATADAGR
ncbi:sensor histidine kinase [Aeromicrobium fastidiosum]|uniref:histidine kinase n=1 Tax=Aeromicrobium fastidiosum TaxID=52699 RepID=A0A641AJ02_9ACTN|nr:ATP-binding protein [Aeromicrobium fastidiosum]KAA1374712.1 hypothetical protein ESP62_015075 [Aeromicrobium fastidiosum]